MNVRVFLCNYKNSSFGKENFSRIVKFSGFHILLCFTSQLNYFKIALLSLQNSNAEKLGKDVGESERLI